MTRMKNHDDIEEHDDSGEILLDLTQAPPAPPKKRRPILWLTVFALLGATGFAGYIALMCLTVPPATPGTPEMRAHSCGVRISSHSVPPSLRAVLRMGNMCHSQSA